MLIDPKPLAVALALPLVAAGASQAQAAECVPKDVHDAFVRQAGLTPASAGLNAAGNVTVVWAGPDGRWLIAVHLADRPVVCAIDAGEAWGAFEVQGPPDAGA